MIESRGKHQIDEKESRSASQVVSSGDVSRSKPPPESHFRSTMCCIRIQDIQHTR